MMTTIEIQYLDQTTTAIADIAAGVVEIGTPQLDFRVRPSMALLKYHRSSKWQSNL